jgi:hypothetical protein
LPGHEHRDWIIVARGGVNAENGQRLPERGRPARLQEVGKTSTLRLGLFHHKMQQTEELLMTPKSIACLAVLLAAGCIPCFADKTDNPRPQKLIRVTLRCDEKLHNTPFDSIAADLVTLARSKDAKKGAVQMVFNALPRATVSLLRDGPMDDAPIVLTLFPEDDGKTIHLTVKNDVCYKNDVPCTIRIPGNMTREDLAKLCEVLRKAKKDKHTDGLTLALQFDESSVSVLKELKGSRVGLFVGLPMGKARLSGPLAGEVTRAIGEVEPRQVMAEIGGLALLDRCRSKIEGLSLMMKSPPDEVPDLSKYTALRRLTLVNMDGHINLKPIAKLTQLEGLTVFSEGCENAGAIASLARLKFLVMPLKSAGDLSYLKLPELQYLAAEFPNDMDFSFAEKMPNLQTLCIWNASEKLNLKPLEKLPKLRCLALAKSRNADMDEAKSAAAVDCKNYKNVKEFQKARPDVEVVGYRGMCLGSIWMLVVGAAAAVAAWLIRRRRVGNRLACQQ